MDDGNDRDLEPIFIGKNRPDVRTFTAGSLFTGLPYRFSVQAINKNGNSAPSAIATFYACRAPTDFKTPVYLSSDQDALEIEIGWEKPS